MSCSFDVIHWFPFGSLIQKVEQGDRSPKKVFILGVYASAIHAKWIGPDGKVIVNAMAVASEPEIFWRGNNAAEEINAIPSLIKLPAGMKLVAADERFNGPSGRTLDSHFLSPLGLTRQDVWLCDLLPYSRQNPNQVKAVQRYSEILVQGHGFPECTIPPFNPNELKSPDRRLEILNELKQSQADTLVLLGDLPIKHFLSHYTQRRYQKLSDFGITEMEYGQPRNLNIEGKEYKVIPLVHPRQANSLGRSSAKWTDLHKHWMEDKFGLRIGISNQEFS